MSGIDELAKCKKELADAIKTFKDCCDTHQAHKDAADAFHAAAKAPSRKDACTKTFKDLADAVKAHKDACDAHKDACGKLHKAILGAAKEDRAKMGYAELLKADAEDMREHLAEQDQLRGYTPSAFGTALQKALDPNDPLYEVRKAIRERTPVL
jgi:hypothetical protein